MRLQQLAQALVVVRGIARPGHLQQRIEHRAAAFFGHVHVGQAGVDGIARIQQRAGQGQEQATLARPTVISGNASLERSLTTRWLAPDIRPMPPPITMPWPQHRIGLA
ncbi:hypothetical protein G6F46_014243 [Rhizopus delemar]|uniref:Uncharacterized protein n=1 Tax=Rhizopus delemar TaxID=936053 RepID=A0A9P7C0A0_9FUNG|nr:hypothetical protein G6F50_017063 [Rhizopus delemar]KAG1597828.1 hypothetical protein G6F46_014243 [Rhizopus delemar]